MRMRKLQAGAVALAFGLAGCNDWQSALRPAGDGAAEIKSLFLIFLGVAALVWIAVMLALLIGLMRRKPPRPDPLASRPATERRAGKIVFVLAAGTVAIVLGLSVLSYFGQRGVFAHASDALAIRVTGHQWWWEVQYEGAPDQRLITANEIRVPVGRPVIVTLVTRDVIHSFWAPSLTGKMDQINNQQNQLQFTAARPGVYRGQCAEFCGLQHAHMGFEVVALPRDQFDAWRNHQRAPARTPYDAEAQRGATLFIGRGCALCHTITGTPANGKLGPDLTHLASRRTIAAATLPLTPGNLAAWISDPQHVKPGNFMPRVPLQAPELNAIVRYLESLT